MALGGVFSSNNENLTAGLGSGGSTLTSASRICGCSQPQASGWKWEGHTLPKASGFWDRKEHYLFPGQASAGIVALVRKGRGLTKLEAQSACLSPTLLKPVALQLHLPSPLFSLVQTSHLDKNAKCTGLSPFGT